MCFVEVYAAGREGESPWSSGRSTPSSASAPTSSNEIPGREDMPPQMVRAMIGGLQKVVHKRLYRDEAGRTARARPADLAVVALLPPAPRPAAGAAPPTAEAQPFEERQAVANPPERVLRALAAIVAEKGYPATTVAEVVERASTSQRTFYEHFANKEEALLAALDSGSAQMLATVLPAFRRGADWQHSVQRRLRGDVQLRHRRARVHAARRGRDVRGRQTRAADPRHDHGRARGAAGSPATSSPRTPRRSPPRRSAARSTR